MNRTPVVLALSASLLGAGLGASSPAQALSGDQESACGAILCLVGGSGVAECAPYLARYFAITAPNPARLFDRRLDFLNLCSASALPGDVRPLIARYGATCQSSTLVNWLNAQIRSCQIRNWDDSDDCRPTGNEWRMCAPFFDHGYTTYEAPTLHERCREERDGDGYLVETCSYTWTEAGAPAPVETSTTRTSPWPLSRAPHFDWTD
jgi:hypothetical protein